MSSCNLSVPACSRKSFRADERLADRFDPVLSIRWGARGSYAGADEFMNFSCRFQLWADSTANRNFSAAGIE
jgi:hypothetical protein